MAFLLTIELCGILAACQWKEVGTYPTEKACMMEGLQAGKGIVPQFRCIKWMIPLPRTKPPV